MDVWLVLSNGASERDAEQHIDKGVVDARPVSSSWKVCCVSNLTRVGDLHGLGKNVLAVLGGWNHCCCCLFVHVRVSDVVCVDCGRGGQGK